MKRFIASISTNFHKSLDEKLFTPIGGDAVLAQPRSADGTELKVISPIMLPLCNAVEPGEHVGISLIITTEATDTVSNEQTQLVHFRDDKGIVHDDISVTTDTQENFDDFMKELARFFCNGNADGSASYDLDLIYATREETVQNALILMRRLLSAMTPSGGGFVEVYADVDLGIRVGSLLMQMIFRYANNVRDLTVVKTVTYSQFLRGAEPQKLYDLSHLIHLDNALHHAEGLGVSSIESLLDLIEMTMDES